VFIRGFPFDHALKFGGAGGEKEGAMYCPSCGAEMGEGASCPSCGTDLRQYVAQHTPAPVPPPLPSGPLHPSPIRAAGTQRSGLPPIAVIAIMGGMLFFIVAVLGILAAIAIPDFLKFQSKAKQSEARMNLGAIFTAEVAYYGEHDRFGATFDQIEWTEQGAHYAFFLPGQAVQPRIGGPYELPADVNPYVSEDTFMAVAVGNIDNDDTLDVWVIDDEKELRNVSNDTMN